MRGTYFEGKPRKMWHVKRKEEVRMAKLKEWLIKDAQSVGDKFT